MQDPAITIRSCLKDNWSLTGDMDADSIRWSTGWYDEEYDQPQITVTPSREPMRPARLGGGEQRIEATYDINLWISMKLATGKGAGKAKDNKWDGQLELIKIMTRNTAGLYMINWAILDQEGQHLDDIKAVPPVLRWMLPLSVWYYVSA